MKKTTVDKVDKALFDELNNKYLRALADYQNLARRTQLEREHAIQEARKQAAASLISIKEDVDNAEGFSKDPGLALIKKKLYDALANLGIEEINPLNTAFSPDTMECIQVVPGDDDNIVVAVHQKGYKSGDTVLRAAMVTVSKKQITDEPITN